MIRGYAVALALVVSLFAAVPGSADDAAQPPDAKEPTVEMGTLDLTVPESPAFTVLGLTPENVVRPTSPRELATALLNGVDRDGNFQTGIAIDTAPYLLVAGRTLTLREYQDHYYKRLLARTQLSLATAKGTDSEDKAARLGIGVRLTPWDDGDPRMDEELIAKIREVHTRELGKLEGIQPWEDEIITDAFGPDETKKWTALRDATAEERADKIRAARAAGLAKVVDRVCRRRLVRNKFLMSVRMSEAEVFRTLGDSGGVLCRLSHEERTAELRRNPRTAILLKRLDGDTEEDLSVHIERLCTPVALPAVLTDENGQTIHEGELFRRLDESPERLCSLDEDTRKARVQTIITSSDSARTLADRLAESLINHVETEIATTLQEGSSEVQRARDAARKRNWNASAWEIGGAPSWISTSGNVSDLTSQGGAVWSSLALDFADVPGLNGVLNEYAQDHSQAILHVRYRFDQEVPVEDGSSDFLQQDDLLIGGRLRIGYERAALSFEGSYVREDPDEGESDDLIQYAAALDIRLVKDLWLNLSFGGQTGADDGDNEAFVLSSVKYGFSSEPSVSPQ